MQYSTPDYPVRRSFDVAGTATVNRRPYRYPNCRLVLDKMAQPVAIRRVIALQGASSGVTDRYQILRPEGIVALSGDALQSWEEHKTHPVN